jgi:hypothetical protein
VNAQGVVTSRFFEPAPTRTLLLTVTARYRF